MSVAVLLSMFPGHLLNLCNDDDTLKDSEPLKCNQRVFKLIIGRELCGNLRIPDLEHYQMNS